jgi:hypothetical protein
MYNLLSVLSDTPVSDTGGRLSLLQSDLKKFYKKTFMSNTGNVYHDCQVVDAFTRAGYKLESYDDDEIFLEPMTEVKQPSTMFVDLN